MTSKTMEITGAGAAGVDERRRPATTRHFGRIDTERGPAPIDVRVEINQPRHDEEPAHIDGLGSDAGQIAPDLGHLSVGKGYVGYPVAAARRIDDATTCENQIRNTPQLARGRHHRHPEERLRRPGGQVISATNDQVNNPSGSERQWAL